MFFIVVSPKKYDSVPDLSCCFPSWENENFFCQVMITQLIAKSRKKFVSLCFVAIRKLCEQFWLHSRLESISKIGEFLALNLKDYLQNQSWKMMQMNFEPIVHQAKCIWGIFGAIFACGKQTEFIFTHSGENSLPLRWSPFIGGMFGIPHGQLSYFGPKPEPIELLSSWGEIFCLTFHLNDADR